MIDVLHDRRNRDDSSIRGLEPDVCDAIGGNPFASQHTPIRVESREAIALELEQLYEVASFMPERIGRIVPFVGTVGLRFTEAVTLTDDRVGLDAGEIRIPRDLNKSRRAKPIPISRAEAQLLREQLLARPAGSRFVFANQKGGRYSESGFRSVWRPALVAAGLADFRLHWLRHTAISLMARAGMKPELIAQRVGHTDGGALVYRRYRHLYSREIKDAVSALDAFLAQSASGQGVVTSDG